jgi:peptide deformylase
MIREILIWPDPLLKKSASPVTEFDKGLKTLVEDMFETMYAAPGVGLAAPQVGVLKNVIVLDTRVRQPDSQPWAMVNPRLVSLEGKATGKEGCLSIPGEAEDVERAARVTVAFQDVTGHTQTLTAEGLLSVAIQHEMDHLQGVLYVDHLSVLKREVLRKRMTRLKSERLASSGGGAPP